VLKAVLDTQILLRGAASATPSVTSRIYTAWDAGRFILLLIELVRRRSKRVPPAVVMTQSRDPDDNKFLDCAVAGSADYIVSGDADLLSLREVQGIPIVDAPTFWQALAVDA